MDLGRGKMSGYRYEVFLLSSSPLLRLYHFISKTLRTVKWDDFRILLPVSWPIHSFTSLKIQCWQHHSLIFLTLDETEMRSNWLRARFPRRNRETGRCENFNCARRFCISKFFSLALSQLTAWKFEIVIRIYPIANTIPNLKCCPLWRFAGNLCIFTVELT